MNLGELIEQLETIAEIKGEEMPVQIRTESKDLLVVDFLDMVSYDVNTGTVELAGNRVCGG